MIEELLTVAQLLKTVPVTGDYWMTMQACVNSVLKVAGEIKKGVGEDAVNNNAEP